MILDIHTDIWTDVTNRRLLGERDVFRTHHLSKWKKGNISRGIFVFWIDPPHDRHPKERLSQMFSSVWEERNDAKDILEFVTDLSTWTTPTSKIKVLLGMEGLSHVSQKDGVAKIEEYHQLGIRHASLTWNEQNDLATGVKGEPQRGLTSFGREVVHKMNQLGILVDVSHLNERSFWDLSSSASKPFMASHSNAKSLCPHRRNLTDAQIIEMGKQGGIIGLNAYHEFVHEERSSQTPYQLALHAAHMAELIGASSICFGFDFCDFLEGDALGSFSEASLTQENYDSGLLGMKNSSEAKEMIFALEKVGFSKKEIQGICYGNFEAFLKRI